MTKEQVLHSFWSAFDLPAYDENSVPDDAVMPYITYSVETGAMEDVLHLHASLWYRSTTWADITAKVHAIAQAIGGNGHLSIECDGGWMFICRGTPFAQRMDDPNDKMIRRMYLNIVVEFLTAY